MTDLTVVLPGFPTHKYVRLLPSLEKNRITTADLLTLDCIEIAKRAHVPLLDVKALSAVILAAVQGNLGISAVETYEAQDGGLETVILKSSGIDVLNSGSTISTLDDDLDRALGGGLPVGYITEVTGESGAGKTQFLLTLLLAAQLPSPAGLSGSALYISTEGALPTTRLSQMIKSHPVLLNADPKPTLDKVMSITTSDLESQDHILRYQVPVAIKRHGIRLIILDSVAANYRAEFERPGAGNGQSGGANMAQRSTELAKLGQLLRELARDYSIAVVVANQVADRFMGDNSRTHGSHSSPIMTRGIQSSPLTRRGTAGVSNPLPDGSLAGPASSIPTQHDLGFNCTTDPMSLDHQQRWFTGWGDENHPSPLAAKNLKTPSLGVIWTTQIACRIALIKRPVYGPVLVSDEETERGEPVLRRWRRWMKVVLAPHTASSGPGLTGAVEFKIKEEGLRAVKKGDDQEQDSNGIFV